MPVTVHGCVGCDQKMMFHGTGHQGRENNHDTSFPLTCQVQRTGCGPSVDMTRSREFRWLVLHDPCTEVKE